MADAQKRTRAAPQAGPRTTLIDLWRGDLSEVVAAFLPLESIATVPLFSRRFRERHPVVLFALARRHGCANAMNVASLDAIAATGRDWSLFSGDSVDAWRPLPADGDAGDCFAVSMVQDTAKRYVEIRTAGQSGHGGGLVKSFDAADRLCVRQLKYRFRFTESNPVASHEDPDEHAFGYFSMGGDADGLSVFPTATDYELTWFGCDEPHDEEEDNPNVVMSVAPGTWYDVTVTFDWTIDDSDENWAFVTCEGDDGTIERKKRVLSSRQPLTAMRLYNYSPSVAHYSKVDVKYSPHTSRDGDFFNSEEE